MKPSLQKLQKFLKLEADRGYDNRAVMGGLERMLGPWEAEARIESIPEDLIQVVVSRLRDYEHLSPRSRAEALEGLWKRIQRETGVNLPPLSLPPNTEEDTQPPKQPQKERRKGKEPEQEKRLEESHLAKSEQHVPVQKLPAEKPAPPAVVQRVPEGPPAALNAPITVLTGVGPRHAQTLARLGLHSLGDMLYYFPRRYDDYTQLQPINRLFYGQEVTIIGTLQSANNRVIRAGKFQLLEAVIHDGTGGLRLTWWNQPWITKRLRPGLQVVVSGKVDQYLGRLVMNNPEVEPLEQQNLNTNRIVPVYPLTANITQRWLRKLMFQVVTYWSPRVKDPLPQHLRSEADLMELPRALQQAHFPDNSESLKAARGRLAFDEIFYLQLGVLRQKRLWQSRTARVFETSPDWIEEKVSRLPFQLTKAQERALEDVRQDLKSGIPMNRLLQGDVGSGKTIIAAMAVAMIASHGAQSALMAPTSILAEQHYKNMLNLLPAQGELQPEQIRLMVGATPESEKRQIREGLESGAIKLVIGTHALIEDPVIFNELQLAIIDEQHRFGVEQRALLRQKGQNPHLLVMTATPIPRSLALTVYGDLDLSVMDEMPPGRQAVETHVLYPRERERAYSLIRSQIEQERQAFIIYPLVEESGNGDTLAAVEEYERLQKTIFTKQKVGLLHGRLKAEEKDTVMAKFRDRQIDILVSTSVVEVGVDIPNATVMLIEGANRFGLAQLHQFRGRVGRGEAKAYCLLIPDSPDQAENERLSVMEQTNDGFVLAERDLEQRGPGQFLGTRQSGYSELQLASLTDVQLIEKARRVSQKIFENDPELQTAEHSGLAAALDRFWGTGNQITKGDIS